MNVLVAIIVVLLAAVSSSPRAGAQEFLDTAGRWKTLTLPVQESGAYPYSIIARNAHVVIGTAARHMFVSRDSGETWLDARNALPAGVNIVWSLAFPDTIATPNRILGIATTIRPSITSIIESTDGGYTWRENQKFPGLDSLVNRGGPEITQLGFPALHFTKSSSSNTPMAFIYSGAGLFASSDGGATWTHRNSSLAMRALAMSDELNGVASFIEFPIDTSSSAKSFGGLSWTSDGGVTWTRSYRFPDGGFFQFHSIRAFSKTEIRAFIPERYQNYLDWRLLRSSDGGRTWIDYRGIKAERPLHGTVIWRDTADVHVICDAAIIQHSDNGGESFHVLRDSAAGWPYTMLDSPLFAGAPEAASDGQYIYLTDAAKVARWRMAEVQPSPQSSSVRNERSQRANGASALLVAPNPVHDGTAQLLINSEVKDLREITIVDALGRVHAVIDVAGRRSIPIPHGLPVGRYTAVGHGTDSISRTPFVIAVAR